MGKAKINRYPLIVMCGKESSMFVAGEDQTNIAFLASIRSLRKVTQVEDVTSETAAETWRSVLRERNLEIIGGLFLTRSVSITEKSITGRERRVILHPFLAHVSGIKLRGQVGFTRAYEHPYCKVDKLNPDKLKQLLINKSSQVA